MCSELISNGFRYTMEAEQFLEMRRNVVVNEITTEMCP
jgi:hypothetical protein